MGRSFHRPGTVKENVLESDFEPLCDGTTRRFSNFSTPTYLFQLLAKVTFIIFTNVLKCI